MASLRLSREWWWETDAEHRFREYLGTTGTLALEDLLGCLAWEFPGAEPADPCWIQLRAHMENAEPLRDFELRRREAGGRLGHKVLNAEPVFRADGRFAGYRGVARDVTPQKEAEAALNASETQLAAVIDGAMDAIVTIDCRGRVVVFNAAAADMFGCTRSEALGAPLDRFVPGLHARIAGLQSRDPGLPRLLARALPVTGWRAGGEPFPLEASVARVDLQDRRLHSLVLRDVSERDAAERARATLESQLRQSQKMEALGIVAGGIAHDFNNMIAAILGNASLARDQLACPQAAAVYVEEIRKAGLRARDMVQRILAFSRKQPAVFTCQPLQPLVADGVQLLRAMLPAAIEVVHQAPAEPVYVRADAAQISQVLMNLGTNAWQALGSKPGRIVIAVERVGDEARLRVTDDGCGIEEAVLAAIFEPFFTTKPHGEGTGLGLAVVRGIVQDHAGRIEVRSTRGQGATFEIALPLAEAPAVPEPAAPAPAPAAGRASGRGQHVLYIDDYPAMVFMVAATLEARNYRVTGFECTRAALQWLAAHAADVDLVLTDYNMPGHSGLELAAEARRLRPGLPVILASGTITDELSEGAARIGVRHLFEKPRGIEELCDLVARVLAPQETQ